MKPGARFLCFFRGHDWNTDAAMNGVDSCDRCRFEFCPWLDEKPDRKPPPTLPDALWWIRSRWQWWMFAGYGSRVRHHWRRYFRSCPDCGKPDKCFGFPVGQHVRCDDIPF